MLYPRAHLMALLFIAVASGCGRTPLGASAQPVPADHAAGGGHDASSPDVPSPRERRDGPAAGDETAPDSPRPPGPGRDAAAGLEVHDTASIDRTPDVLLDTALDVKDAGATPMRSLVIIPRSAVVGIGKQVQFFACIQIGIVCDPYPVDKKMVWSVDDPKLASISSNGVAILTGLAEGTTNLVGTFENLTGTVVVRVVPNAPKTTSVWLSYTTTIIPVGGTARYWAGNDFGEVTEIATWRSSNNAVANVSNIPGNKGQATGISPGKTHIEAQFDGVTGFRDLLVVPRPPDFKMFINPVNPAVSVTGTIDFVAWTRYPDGTEQWLTIDADWSSSNNAVATVQYGNARCHSAGGVEITTAYAGATATTNLNCGDEGIVAVRITPSNATVPAGVRIQYFATAYFRNGTSRDVTPSTAWSSSDPGVVSVTKTGIVATNAPGLAIITAQFTNLGGTASIKVTAN